MIKIAAVNSTTADKAAANVVCDGVNDQTDITTALGSGAIQVFLFNGAYQIDAPIDVPNEGILIGNSVHGVELVCNTSSGVMRSNAPASRHEHVLIHSMSIVPGSSSTLGCDFLGFVRSQFNRLCIYNFSLGVWFGGDVPTYESCWTNVFREFYLSVNLVGIKLSGTDGGGTPTANNIMILEGEIICRNASGGIAIDVVNAGELVVNSCDIGYGDQSAGIILRSGVQYSRITNSRFEWSSQGSGLYPIKVESGSFYNYFAGNAYSGGCRKPNMYDANGSSARYIEIDDFAHSADFPYGYVDFATDVVFREIPTFSKGLYVRLNQNTALGIAKADNTALFNVTTTNDWVQIVNGGELRLFSDDFTTTKMTLSGSNGRLSLAGDIVTSGTAPTLTKTAAMGTGSTVSVSGTNTAGLLTLTTGTGPTTGKLVDITWSATKASANYAIVLTAANANAVAALSKIYADQSVQSTTVAAITASAALTASTSYKFYYSVINY